MPPETPLSYSNLFTWGALLSMALAALAWGTIKWLRPPKPNIPPPANRAEGHAPHKPGGGNQRRNELRLLNETLFMLAEELDSHSRPSTEARRPAYRDKLTGLPNQIFLDEFAIRMESKKLTEDGAIVVLYCNIDNFEETIEAHGDAARARLLVETARRFQRTLRANDIAVRLDGDKFVVLIEARKNECAALSSAVARRLIEHTRQPLLYNDVSLAMGISIGAAFWPEHGEKVDAVVREAETALRVAKRTGKNGFEIIRR
jgi:diguanylate cyclase (GGDEF)-like protein